MPPTDWHKARYGAYYKRDKAQENVELTHVGPGTPCGEYFRRFWLPVVFSDELKDLPVRVCILGEDLVVFRDYSGRIGVLQAFCSHRGAPLEFGQIRDRGIQCCYHGWLYDVDGTILDTPGEPQTSTIKDELSHGAYPAQEYKEIVFAYMGPPEKIPTFPEYDFLDYPEFPKVLRVRNLLPCNWLQIKENAMDPLHLYFLHATMTGPHFSPDLEQVPEHNFIESPLGMVYTDSRRMDDNLVWVRVADYLAPTTHQFPAGASVREKGRDFERPTNTVYAVPVDDRHTMNLRILRFREGERIPEDPEARQGFGQTANRPYEERQRKPGDYEARVGIHDGLAVHARECLGSTDIGITMLRGVVRRGIQAVQRGDDPKGVFRDSNGVVPTYAHQRIVHVPKAVTEEADRLLVRETGRKIAEEVFNDPMSLHRLASR